MHRMFIASILAGLILLTGLAVAAGKPSGDTPVVMTITDGSYSVRSDGGGSYLNGTSGVISILQSILGDLEFDEYTSTRRIYVTLNDPAAGSPANPLGNFNPVVPGRIMAKTSEYLTGSLPSMTMGQQTNSQLSIGFRIYSSPKNYKQYRFDNNPLMHPGTDPAMITCTGVKSTGLCNAWHIQPSGSYGGVQKNLAYFENVTDSNNPVHIGDYYLTFDLNLHE